MSRPAAVPAAALRLHERALVFDAHADTLTEMCDRGYDLGAGPTGSHLDLPRCAGGALDAQVFTCFVHPVQHAGAYAARVGALLDVAERQLRLHPDALALCRLPDEIAAARAAGRLAMVLAIEGGHAIEDDLEHLAAFARRGVRTMTLTWNNSNEWADGCGERGPHGGLTARGRDVVAWMEDHGLVVDVSHVARATFDDVLSVARGALLASHSCARALCDHARNLDDDQLAALAATGGVVGVNFHSPFLVAGGRRATLDDVLDHVDHMLAVAGPDHVALGSDYDGIPLAPLGLEDVACLPRLTAGLLARGHGEDVVERVLGRNLLRLFDGPPAQQPTDGAAAPAARAEPGDRGAPAIPSHLAR